MQVRRLLDTGSIALPEEGLAKPLDFIELFGNDRPVELEIGSGKGTFLVREATLRPDTNFVGLEWARFYWRYTCDRARRAGVTNVRAGRFDANVFLRDHVPDASLTNVHIYFPDPWPKARHQRRRLVQPAFLLELRRVLVPGGTVSIVTDHDDYAAHIARVLGDLPVGLSRGDYTPPAGAREGEVVGTNFERKYIPEGRVFRPFALAKD